ncbi:MAG TPA: SPOR domain-containing protein [Hyphomicrobiaceae bacterium]|jgi:hypothetical protein|nr:SPOR domain-containing protein [Hyphomicrobiaceae bacterium]
MSRSNSAAGRIPPRRHPAEHDPYAQHANGHWPPANAGAGYPGQAPAHPQQGYYFPPAQDHQDPNYNYPPQGDPAYPPQQPSDWGHQQQQPDPRGYDLGTYMPAGQPQGYGAHEPPPFQAPGQPGAQFAPHADYGEADAEYDDAYAEFEDEPRRGGRAIMIAGALVGAIVLGGAGAYGYKTLFGHRGGHAPLVRAANLGPDKVRPAEPGGRPIPHQDKTLFDRLGEGAGPARAEAAPLPSDANEDPSRPRRVRIIPITPGGNAPPAVPITTASAPREAMPQAFPTPSDPGDAQPSRLGAQAVPPAAPVAREAPAPVKIVSVQPPAAAAPTPEPPARKVVHAPPKAPVTKTAKAHAPAAPQASGANGYVAVLSSQKSRMDALKVFADMQQKYGEVLSSKTPDVQEANLGEKGVWYRAVVGPPGSREAASGLCSQLKSAGYSGCWVTAY